MNAQQLNAALGLSITEALKSVGREIDPAQIVGVIEMHKQAVIGHIAAAQQRPELQIVPANRIPKIHQ